MKVIDIDSENQTNCCLKLLWAVVFAAITDAKIKPIKVFPETLNLKTKITKANNLKKYIPNHHAKSAISFLFTDSSNGYFEYLNIDPEIFRKKLLKEVFYNKEKNNEWGKNQKRYFKFNYLYFKKNMLKQKSQI
jgi:hypothetical protein